MLPIVEKLNAGGMKLDRGRPPRVIVLAPTRELAKQVHLVFKDLWMEGHAMFLKPFI